MAYQEFLASFGVEIDEAGVTRLQAVLAENRALAEKLAGAFDTASASLRTFSEELGVLPDFTGRGIAAEGLSGSGNLSLELDLSPARKELDAFVAQAKKPVPLSGNAAGIISAGRSAYSSLKSIFSAPLTIRANVVRTVSGGTGNGTESGTGDSAVLRMSSGGRFAKPTDVQVAEDGDAEYIIPVKKEDRAVPLLRQLLAELSPAARDEALTSAVGGNPVSTEISRSWQLPGSGAVSSEAAGSLSLLSGGISAGMPPAGSITQDNRTVSAPVSIQVHAASANAEQVGRSLYDTAERYLLRTLEDAFA